MKKRIIVMVLVSLTIIIGALLLRPTTTVTQKETATTDTKTIVGQPEVPAGYVELQSDTNIAEVAVVAIEATDTQTVTNNTFVLDFQDFKFGSK